MTIKEIADMANVSITTVSKIANGKDEHISPETRKRVMDLIRKFNYTPYSKIREGLTPNPFLIAVILRSTVPSSTFVHGIVTCSEARGYSILLFNSEDDPNLEFRNIVRACQLHVSGILWEPVSANIDKTVSYVREQHIPCQLINSLTEESEHIDFQSMGYTLTEELIQNRHKQLCAVLVRNNLRSSLVLAGFKACLYDHQIPFRNQMVLYEDDPNSYSVILTNRFTGAVCSHFSASIRLYEQLEKLHYYVPADFSIVSLKNDAREEVSYPRISCLHIPYRLFGKQVADKIIGQAEGTLSHNICTDPVMNQFFDNKESIAPPPSMRSGVILVVGSINRDETFRVTSPPQLGKTITVDRLSLSLGGKGANQAVGVARLGRQVSLVSAVGDDTDGSFILDQLEKENVSTSCIKKIKGSVTGRACIYTIQNGESAIAVQPGANAFVSPELIREAHHAFNHAGYCLISSEIPIETVIATASISKSHGLITMLKPAAMNNLPEKLYRLLDYFIPNRKEASILCPNSNTTEEQADYFFQMGIPNVIITLGSAGCYVKTAYKACYYRASPFHAVDTTGGADAFIAALAAYLARNYSVDKAVQIANYAAGFCIAKPGVINAMVDLESLESYIRKTTPDLL
ncbi:PfkB family carbohydrate kinase [Lachnoclostridium sp. Marseille-P6806]|uniref:PfkB family carbohydrate kinase n=1 Tax=Lachnoclostridium sp. Marseille-P6806 TaxID=2364793 RepID=UPI00103275CE|nr:PfkB family carbohydrate kinase [Lachnoclostridium sp. Marseille-P6806]